MSGLYVKTRATGSDAAPDALWDTVKTILSSFLICDNIFSCLNKISSDEVSPGTLYHIRRPDCCAKCLYKGKRGARSPASGNDEFLYPKSFCSCTSFNVNRETPATKTCMSARCTQKMQKTDVGERESGALSALTLRQRVDVHPELPEVRVFHGIFS